MRQALTYIEIDLDFCSLTYSIAPCEAALGVTGNVKCYNTIKTCQDRVHFTNDPITIRFGVDTAYLPVDIDCVPSLKSVDITPGTISLGKNLGQRTVLTAVFMDHPHPDTLPGYFDKYLSDRGYDPYSQGSFWGKFRARFPYVRGRDLRLIRGFVGQTLIQMETRHYVMDSFSGPDPQTGSFTITAKDILKLADDDRSKAPILSNGSLLTAIAAGDTNFTLTPEGIGNLEYDLEGYVALGGNESVKFNRDAGLDSFAKLLLHMDGTDGSTTFTDSSTGIHTVTPSGNAQLDTTAAPKFGSASGLFDGTGDYLSLDGHADFAFGTGDFTIDFQVRLSGLGLGTLQYLYDSRPSGGTGLYPVIRITTGNVVVYEVNGTVRITGTSTFSGAVWYHVALVRYQGITRLYRNGTQEGSDYTDTNDYIIGTNRPVLAGNGNSAGSNTLNGWLDELRVSKGIARWTQNFIAPSAAYSTTSGDRFEVVRAQLNSTAQAFQAGDRVQTILAYIGEDPADIFYDLLVNYAGVNPSFIPLVAWQLETATYLQRVYTAYIAEPVGVNQLCSELIEQSASAMWWDDLQQLIQLQVLRSVPTSALLFDDDLVMRGTLKIAEQPDKRLTEIWTFFAQRNPLEPQTDRSNYAQALATVDLQAATDYGSSVVLPIFSRWIPQFATTVVERLNNIQLGRFRDPPRKINFDVFRDEIRVQPVLLGGGYRVKGWSTQSADGAREVVPFQITQLKIAPDRYKVAGEEVLFTTFDPTDLFNRVITISSDTFNFNLREVHDTIYPEIDDPSYITLTCIVAAGVKIGSINSSLPAFDVGNWPAGLNITIQLIGRIQGKGGNAGNVTVSHDGGSSYATATSPQNGSTALYTRYPIFLDDNSGETWGGGGGGAPGYKLNVTPMRGAAGGGGQGYTAGDGGVGTSIGDQNPVVTSGTPGTIETAGVAGAHTGFDAGDGGTAGNDGGDGQLINQIGGTTVFSGGNAGAAIDGISYVTQVGSPGDRRGPEIN